MEELLARFSKKEIIHAYITQQNELEGYEKERAILISKLEELTSQLTDKVEHMDFIVSSFIKSLCKDEMIDLYDVAAKLNVSICGIKKILESSCEVPTDYDEVKVVVGSKKYNIHVR